MNVKVITKNCGELSDVKRNNDSGISKDFSVLTQEVKIVKALVCNDINVRTKQLKKLSKWLKLRSNSSFAFTQQDFLRLWKGLYYNMWMSDKPLVQEELAEYMGTLIDCFNDINTGIQFFGAFLRTMCNEWFGIDQWRMDKFLMLIRRMLRCMFRALKSNIWTESSVDEFNSHIFNSVLAKNTCTGLKLHILDIFYEELAKVSRGELSTETVCKFIKPFVKFMVTEQDSKILGHCRNRVFYHLLYQSELGREYIEKYNAWKSIGFPTCSIDDLEKTETFSDCDKEETEISHRHLDPRAGNVSVFMPALSLDANYIIAEINRFINKTDTSIKSRRLLKGILQKFVIFRNGIFPLGVKTIPRIDLECKNSFIREKIDEIESIETEVYSTSRKLKQLNKKKRKKLLASLNFTNADDSIIFEQLIEKALPKQSFKVKGRKRKAARLGYWREEEIKECLPSKMKKYEKKQDQNCEKKCKKMIESNQRTNSISSETINFISKKIKVGVTQSEDELKLPISSPCANFDDEHCYIYSDHHKNVKKQLIHSFTPTKHSATIHPSAKRVKIALNNNTSQKPSEYFKQIKSSPNVPFDADKKPSKGLLKPNLIPSPINPFYKKKVCK